MEDEFLTPRLRLVRIQSTDDGMVFDHYHKIWTDEQATQWSLHGAWKTREDSRKWMAGLVPSPTVPGSDRRLGYLVLCRSEAVDGPTNISPTGAGINETEWEAAGIISLLPTKPLSPAPQSTEGSTRPRITVDLGYLLVAGVWGRGYATESVKALLEHYKNSLSHSGQDTPIDVQATVHFENPRSVRVLEKLGFQEVLKTESEGLVRLGGRDRKDVVIHFKKTI